ncbi:MAG: hypothetical protein HOF85_00710 [Acidiferrobacteraceae bacterium]|nr:hypothetical protein [Acidiferrobacteraceae bacterium]MBT4404292.1 hypothetical protein [Acidiferrobacteraceae bacterium]MBT5981386.1 hypothetical protein [Acidiferrobacteraceae bacterium]
MVRAINRDFPELALLQIPLTDFLARTGFAVLKLLLYFVAVLIVQIVSGADALHAKHF